MRKKILLFSAGVVVAVGSFSAYWAATGGANPFAMPGQGRPRAPIAPSDQPDVFEQRDDVTGQLQYVLVAKHANLVQPGHYVLDQPSGTYYLQDGERAVMRADSGTLNVDQVGGVKGRPVPKGGTLSGHVTLTIGPPESFVTGSTAVQPGQVQATLDEDLDFDYARRELTSPGQIHVRSGRQAERVSFDGESLTLTFNRDQKRIEYLRVARNGKMTITQPDRAFGEGERGNSAAPAAPATGAAGSGAATTAPAPGATAYRLTFGQDVKAAWGTRMLSCDQGTVIFQTGRTAPTTEKAAEGPATAATAPTTGTAPATSPAAADDLVITWSGPMEMRPMPLADAGLADAKDRIFEASSLPGRSVVLQDGDRTARAGKLWYETATQKARLDPGPAGTVDLADAKLGTLVAQGMTWLRATGQVAFSGAGHARMLEGAMQNGGAAAEPKKGPTTVAWTKSLDLTLAPDVRKTGKTGLGGSQVIREAILSGDADVRDPAGFWIHGESIDALVAQTKEGKQVLEHMLATGKVQATRFRSASPGMPANAEPDGLRAERLEVKTAPGPGDKGPQPDVVLADGDVVAVIHQVDKKEPTKVQRWQIGTPKLVAYLEPKAAGATAPAATGAAEGFGGSAIRRVEASQGVQVRLDGYGPQPVEVSADTLQGDPKAGTAELRGVDKAGATQLVHLKQGDRQITGRTMLLDREAESLDVPGPGDVLFVEPAKKPGEKPTPVQVQWSTAMRYSGKAHEAVFAGAARAMVVGRPDEEGALAADRITAKLAGAETPAKAATGDLPVADSAKLSEILAEGNVDVSGATYDPNHKLLTRLHLLKVAALTVDRTRDRVTIPGGGEMFVEDYRPEPADKADSRSARGKTGFTWEQGLTYTGSSGEIELKKNVKMVHQPTKPLNVPAMAGGGDAAGGTTKPAEGIKTVLLTCADLKALLAKSEGGGSGTSSPFVLGTSENTGLSHVTATGNAQLTLDENVLRAETLALDTVKNKAVAVGQGENYVQLHRPAVADVEARRIEWDLTKEGGFVLEGVRGRGVLPAGTGGP